VDEPAADGDAPAFSFLVEGGDDADAPAADGAPEERQ
jgi:hypothetical protein